MCVHLNITVDQTVWGFCRHLGDKVGSQQTKPIPERSPNARLGKSPWLSDSNISSPALLEPRLWHLKLGWQDPQGVWALSLGVTHNLILSILLPKAESLPPWVQLTENCLFSSVVSLWLSLLFRFLFHPKPCACRDSASLTRFYLPGGSAFTISFVSSSIECCTLQPRLLKYLITWFSVKGFPFSALHKTR